MSPESQESTNVCPSVHCQHSTAQFRSQKESLHTTEQAWSGYVTQEDSCEAPADAAKLDTSLVDWKQSIESSNTCAQSSDCSQLHYTQSSESREEGTVNTRSLAAGCSTEIDAAATTIDGIDDLLGCRTLFQVTGDHVDLEIKTKFMTLDRRNKSLHWFDIMATDERVVPPYILHTVGPRCSILSVPDSEFFPAVVDYQHLRSDFVILVSRVVQ